MKVAPTITALMVFTLSHLNPHAHAAEEAPPADWAEQLTSLRREVRDYRDELSAMRRQRGDSWLNEQRTAEVKALIGEVLADADTRASLQGDSPTAGYRNGFFMGSADGNYLMRINFEGQVRYVHNDSEQPSGTDEEEGGFVVRRARLDIRGNAIDPKLTYRFRFNADRANGNMFLEYAYLGYAFADGWNVNVGQYKPQFVREENVSGFRQLAVERSYVADYFTIDFAQGAEVSYTGDWLRAFFNVHDGSYSANTEFNADRTNVAAAARAEALLAGDWRQFDDFTSWSSDKFGLMLGAAIDYEIGEEGSGTHNPDVIKYALDASLELGGANVFAAFTAQSFDDNGSAPSGGIPTNLDGADQFGLVVQGGVFVIPDTIEVFARYEWMDFDGVYYRNNGAVPQSGTANLNSEDELSIVTAGVNWYFQKHNAKWTLDVQYALDPIPVANTGGGIVNSAEDGQLVLRGQLQWSF